MSSLEHEMPLWRRLLHWGPLLAMAVIGEISMSTLYCHLQWWPAKTIGGFLDIIVFLFWNVVCLNNLIYAAHAGPGHVPRGWVPPRKEDAQRLQFCSICGSFKAPRSHHCRKCRRCVQKMDHHCPWINNCCGFGNQGAFIRFLASAVVGCVHATFILGPSIYFAVFRVWYLLYGTGKEPLVHLGIYSLISAVFAFGLAIGVIFSVGFLLIVQMRSVLRNRTGIEDYIVAKANAMRKNSGDGPFTYPYGLDWRQNLSQVLTLSGRPVGDGLWWPVVEGCHQFTLSLEQMRQKRVKRANSILYVVVRDFDGGILTCRFGCRVMCCQPWSEEPRIRVHVGEKYLVTRWAKYWRYGERMAEEEKESREEPPRGWFPKDCVRRVRLEDEDEEEEQLEPESHPKQA